MVLPSLQDLVLLQTPELEAAIKAALLPALTFTIYPVEDRLILDLKDQSGTVVWQGYSNDRRTLLFDMYGEVLKEAGYRPQHPLWQRRGEVQIPARYGQKAYQGAVHIPDPEDLNPDELLKIYGIHTKKDSSQ